MDSSGDFWDFMRSTLLEKAHTYKGLLEEYLSALWATIQEHRDSTVSYSLIAGILAEALTRDPPPFDEQWLSYTKPPDVMQDHAPTSREEDYKCLQQMILYQISDLHRMEQAGLLNNPLIYYGVTSPTGRTWYNFHPATFLECATAPDWLRSIESPLSGESSWTELAILLWVGQNYE